MLPGQLNPLGFVAGMDEAQRLDFWAVVVASVWELRQDSANHLLRVGADAYFGKAALLNPLVGQGFTMISRMHKDAVGWDTPPPSTTT